MGIKKTTIAEFYQNHAEICSNARCNGEIIELDYPDSDLGMYVINTHQGINEVLRNADGNFVHFADYFASLENKSEVDKQIGDIFAKNLGNDDEIHLELRKDIRTHFNGGGVDQHIGFIQQCVGELITNLRIQSKKNGGIVDLVKHFNEPFAFLVTSHIIGLSFEDSEDKILRTEQAAEAIQIINLLASDDDKRKALSENQALSNFILPQLKAYAADTQGALRSNCLLHDFGIKLREGEDDKLENYIQLVNGLFQAGLGAVGSFIALCLHFLLKGDSDNSAADLQAYYFDPSRTDDEKREAIEEFIRLEQAKLSGLIPRYAKADTPLMGETIKGNSLVYMNFASANLDSAAFKTPRQFKAGRSQTPQGLSKEALTERRQKRLEKNVSFSFGEHMCPGRRISLTMIRYAIDGIFEAFPDITIDNINIFSEVMGKPTTVVSFHVKLQERV